MTYDEIRAIAMRRGFVRWTGSGRVHQMFVTRSGSVFSFGVKNGSIRRLRYTQTYYAVEVGRPDGWPLMPDGCAGVDRP